MCFCPSFLLSPKLFSEGSESEKASHHCPNEKACKTNLMQRNSDNQNRAIENEEETSNVLVSDNLGACNTTLFNIMNDKIAIKPLSSDHGEWIRIFFNNNKYVECDISQEEGSERIPCSYPIRHKTFRYETRHSRV